LAFLSNIFAFGWWQEMIFQVERALGGGRWEALLGGLWVTIQLSLGAVILGIIIGSVIAAFRMSNWKILRGIASVYLAIIRGTPAVTQILIVNATIFGALRGVGLWVGIVGLGINSGAYVAEIIRAGILSVDKGQTEAGLSLGFSRARTMMFIVMPQAVKNILPTLVNEFIVLIKETAIVGFIGVGDLTRVASQIMSRTFNPTVLFISAGMYLVLIGIVTALLGVLERRLRSSDTRGEAT